LTAEEQRGLYGELFFLRKYLSSNNNYSEVINSWLGPHKEIKDFQLRQWAVEVKTSKEIINQKVIISNERTA
jgi:hypothetical protein